MVNDTKKRESFKNLLTDLAKEDISKNLKKDYYQRLEQLYGSDQSPQRFRHYYSDIFPCLVNIENSQDKDMDILVQNLKVLLEKYRKRKDIDISQSLRKLYDHVSLDMARIRYISALVDDSKGDKEIQGVHARINQLESSIDQANKTIKSGASKLENVQKEYIAILSIFASIILAASGGITFSAEAISNISDENIWNLLFVFAFITWLFLNLLFLLMYYIGSLLDKDLDNKYYLTYTNIVMFLIVLVTMIVKCVPII